MYWLLNIDKLIKKNHDVVIWLIISDIMLSSYLVTMEFKVKLLVTHKVMHGPILNRRDWSSQRCLWDL